MEAIKSIPISIGGREDMRIWRLTNNGMYTVRSGNYHLHRDLVNKGKGEYSNRTKDQTVWKATWKLKLAPVVKMFIWRAYSEALPTYANLNRRKIITDSLCPICRQEPETSGHALWGCAAAKDVWNQGFKKVQKMNFHSDLIFDIWSALAETLETLELEEVAVTLRGIWTRRNDFLHRKDFKHPTILSQQARAELVSYKTSITTPNIPQTHLSPEVHKWSKPPQDQFKINWDAAVKEDEGKIGLGVIIRDFQGLVIGVLRASRNFRGTPFDAEAHGLLLAVVFRKEIGLKHVCLEGDSKQVVDSLQNHTSNWSLGGCLISDARKILDSSTTWTTSHTYRMANSAAHHLAKAAMNCPEDIYDIEVVPTCIMTIVSSDMV